MSISPTEWIQYQKDWMRQLRKHQYESSYALNLMNQTWISITELKVPVEEHIENALKFTELWHTLLIFVKNTHV